MGLFIITIHSLNLQRPTLAAAAPSGPRKALFTSVPCGYCRLHRCPQESDFRRRKAWQIRELRNSAPAPFNQWSGFSEWK